MVRVNENQAEFCGHGTGGGWANELHATLWAYKTSHKHGVEAIIPVEIGMSSARITTYNPDINEDSMREALNLVYEKKRRSCWKEKGIEGAYQDSL